MKRKIRAWAVVGTNEKIGVVLFVGSMSIYFTKKEAKYAIEKNNGFKIVPCTITIEEAKK